MSVRITEDSMTSDEVPVSASWSPDGAADGNGAWSVSWVPGRRLFNRNQAITAMTLAEYVHAHQHDVTAETVAFIKGWAAELHLSAGEAVTAIQAALAGKVA